MSEKSWEEKAKESRRHLERIAGELGIPLQDGLKYNDYELFDLITKSIHIRKIQGNNLRKRLAQLEKASTEQIGFWRDGTIGGRFYE